METPIIPGQNNLSARNRKIIIACVIFDIVLLAGLAYYFLVMTPPADNVLQPSTQETDTRVVELEDKLAELEQKLAQSTMQQPEEEGPPTLEQQEPPSAQTTADNLFNPTTAKYGDMVAGLTIAQIGPFNPEYSGQSADNIVVIFNGEVTVSGKWEHYNGGLIGTRTCMNPDEESIAILPKTAGDTRITWFCFNDEDGEKLGPEGTSGTATLVIDGYTYVSYPSEVVNSARLVKILSKD
jgi:hypothetical protein